MEHCKHLFFLRNLHQTGYYIFEWLLDNMVLMTLYFKFEYRFEMMIFNSWFLVFLLRTENYAQNVFNSITMMNFYDTRKATI